MARTVEAASRGLLRRGLRFFRKEELALASLKSRFRLFPSVLFYCDAQHAHRKAVVKMSVTS